MTLLEMLRRARERRDSLVGMNRRNVELVYPHNPRALYPLADDKILAKRLLAEHGVPVPETLVECRGLFEVGPTVERLRGEENFVVKPACGSGGDGILVVGDCLGQGRFRTAGGREIDESVLRKHLADTVFGAYSKQLEDRAFVERRIRPHPFFEGLWAKGLCDVRVILLERRPIVSMVRVPTERSDGRANLHQGGIGLAVDLRTGATVAAQSAGVQLARHPESGAPLVGLTIPRFDEILAVARASAAAFPLGYLGVDLVLDRDAGPLVLEVNARPGLEIQNVHGRGLGELLSEAFS